MTAERWRAIPGWAGYRVSDLGRVKTVTRKLRDGRTAGGIVLKLEIGTAGYPMANLHRNGRRRRQYVHRLVMRAFVGPCPPGMEVRHLNGDRLDCRLVNLEYGTHPENIRDQEAHGTSGRGLTAELAREIRERYAADPQETYISMSAAYGVSTTTIRQVLRGITWDHVGGPRSNGQRPRPWARPWAKLTDDAVRDILARHASGETARSLAVSYGVTASTIGQVVRRTTWRHVTEEGIERRKESREEEDETARPLRMVTGR